MSKFEVQFIGAGLVDQRYCFEVLKWIVKEVRRANLGVQHAASMTIGSHGVEFRVLESSSIEAQLPTSNSASPSAFRANRLMKHSRTAVETLNNDSTGNFRAVRRLNSIKTTRSEVSQVHRFVQLCASRKAFCYLVKPSITKHVQHKEDSTNTPKKDVAEMCMMSCYVFEALTDADLSAISRCFANVTRSTAEIREGARIDKIDTLLQVGCSFFEVAYVGRAGITAQVVPRDRVDSLISGLIYRRKHTISELTGGSETSSVQQSSADENGEKQQLQQQRSSDASLSNARGPGTTTLLLEIADTFLCLINTVSKCVVWSREIRNISYVFQGNSDANSHYVGLVVRENTTVNVDSGTNSGNEVAISSREAQTYNAYVLECAEKAVADDCIYTLRQAFETTRNRNPEVYRCPACPVVLFNTLIQRTDRILASLLKLEPNAASEPTGQSLLSNAVEAESWWPGLDLSWLSAVVHESAAPLLSLHSDASTRLSSALHTVLRSETAQSSLKEAILALKSVLDSAQRAHTHLNVTEAAKLLQLQAQVKPHQTAVDKPHLHSAEDAGSSSDVDQSSSKQSNRGKLTGLFGKLKLFSKDAPAARAAARPQADAQLVSVVDEVRQRTVSLITSSATTVAPPPSIIVAQPVIELSSKSTVVSPPIEITGANQPSAAAEMTPASNASSLQLIPEETRPRAMSDSGFNASSPSRNNSKWMTVAKAVIESRKIESAVPNVILNENQKPVPPIAVEASSEERNEDDTWIREVASAKPVNHKDNLLKHRVVANHGTHNYGHRHTKRSSMPHSLQRSVSTYDATPHRRSTSFGIRSDGNSRSSVRLSIYQRVVNSATRTAERHDDTDLKEDLDEQIEGRSDSDDTVCKEPRPGEVKGRISDRWRKAIWSTIIANRNVKTLRALLRQQVDERLLYDDLAQTGSSYVAWQAVLADTSERRAPRSLATLRRLVTDGVPKALRGQIWLYLIEQHKARRAYELEHENDSKSSDLDTENDFDDSMPPTPLISQVSFSSSFSNSRGNRQNATLRRRKERKQRLNALLEKDSLSSYSISSTRSTVTSVDESMQTYESLLDRLTGRELQRAIMIDLGRTFPQYPYFSSGKGVGQLSLYNVLKAYSLFDPEVGYCQGLGFIAGVLLLHLSEHEAFYVLSYYMNEMNFRELYLPNMLGLQIQEYQLEHLLLDEMPALHYHLAQHGIAPSLYASSWFLTMFAANFPISVVVRLFDFLFCDGSAEVMVRIALLLLTEHSELFMSFHSLEALIDCFKSTLPKIAPVQIERIIAKLYDCSLANRMRDYELEFCVTQETQNEMRGRVTELENELDRARSLLQRVERFVPSDRAETAALRKQILQFLNHQGA